MLQPIYQHGSEICIIQTIVPIGTILFPVWDFIHEIRSPRAFEVLAAATVSRKRIAITHLTFMSRERPTPDHERH